MEKYYEDLDSIIVNFKNLDITLCIKQIKKQNSNYDKGIKEIRTLSIFFSENKNANIFRLRKKNEFLFQQSIENNNANEQAVFIFICRFSYIKKIEQMIKLNFHCKFNIIILRL